MKNISGRLIFAVTALIVAILCLVRLFVPALCVGGIGFAAALIIALFRHGSGRLDHTANEAARQLEESGEITRQDGEDRESS